MLLLQHPKMFNELLKAQSYLDVDKSEHFQKMLKTDFIYIKWIDGKMKFVRFDRKIIKTL